MAEQGSAREGLTLRLPRPPSVNAMYQNASRGRVKTPTYRSWCIVAGNCIPMRLRGSFIGKYSIHITVERENKRTRDLDNLIKPINDALKVAGVIRDDSDCEHITMDWLDVPKDKSPEVHITLKEWK